MPSLTDTDWHTAEKPAALISALVREHRRGADGIVRRQTLAPLFSVADCTGLTVEEWEADTDKARDALNVLEALRGDWIDETTGDRCYASGDYTAAWLDAHRVTPTVSDAIDAAMGLESDADLRAPVPAMIAAVALVTADLSGGCRPGDEGGGIMSGLRTAAALAAECADSSIPEAFRGPRPMPIAAFTYEGCHLAEPGARDPAIPRHAIDAMSVDEAAAKMTDSLKRPFVILETCEATGLATMHVFRVTSSKQWRSDPVVGARKVEVAQPVAVGCSAMDSFVPRQPFDALRDDRVTGRQAHDARVIEGTA